MSNESKIEIIPEEKKIQDQNFIWPKLTKILTVVSVVILISVVLLQTVIFLLNKDLVKEEARLNNNQINSLFDKAEKISQLQQNLEEMKNIISPKSSPLEVLNILDKTTLPGVYWSSFSFKRSDNFVSLSGNAPDYKTAGQQLLILKKAGLVKKTVSNFSLDGSNRVNFSGQFNLNFENR